LKQQFCGLNGVCVAWISGFAATGGNWWDQTPSENWANFDNILNFMNVHLFNEISVRTTHEWRTGYENDDDKKVEVVYMYRSGDDPKAVGIIFNLNYNPSNMCDPDDWPFLTEGDFQQIDSRNLYYQNSSNPDRPNEFEENYFLQSDMGSFVVNLINTDSPYFARNGPLRRIRDHLLPPLESIGAGHRTRQHQFGQRPFAAQKYSDLDCKYAFCFVHRTSYWIMRGRVVWDGGTRHG
jgi:hypothetical protein